MKKAEVEKKRSATKKKTATKRKAAKKKTTEKVVSDKVDVSAFEGSVHKPEQFQIKALLEDVQKIFHEAIRVCETDEESPITIPAKELARLTGVTLALAHQLHEYGQTEPAKILEGAWTIAASLVQKLGGEVVVTSDDLEEVAGTQLKKQIVDDNSSVKLFIHRKDATGDEDGKQQRAG
jgi:hypothetical protein